MSHPLTLKSNLLKFESLLSPLFREVGLIGEIPLSNDEEIEIEQALHELLRSVGLGEATSFLREQVPCTLACFLVWKGIQDYHAGNYWEEVGQSVGLPRANLSSKWGEIFEEVLQRFQLAGFRGGEGHRFVAPILIHGGIPNYCLEDFFEKVTRPAVEGRLDYDGNADYLIDEWQEQPSLVLSTDKPVRRFLKNGGKVATDFLQRCLDMAFQASAAGSLPSGEDYGLPSRVVERFSRWFENVASQSPAQTHRRTDLPRYRAPGIFLNAAAGCLLFSFPSQRISRSLLSEGIRLTLEVQQDGERLRSAQVFGTIKGELIETDPCDFDFSSLGESYEVTLSAGDKRLRAWTFSGVSSNHPWMIFHGTSGRLLHERVVTERDFWIVFSSSWEISTTIQAIEAATLTREFQAQHFRVTEGPPPDISLTDEKGQSLSVPIEWRDTPTLEPKGVFTWPYVSSGEFTVYRGTPPNLLIPLPFNEQEPTIPERFHLTITPTGESYPATRREIPLKTRFAASNLKDRFLRLSLEDLDLLSPNPCGRFIIRVRGRLGQDTTFRICILPEMKFYFPREKLLPDQNTGSQPLSFTLESPCLKELTVEPPAEGVSNADYHQIEVPVGSEQVTLKACFAAGEATAEVPLEIPVSRLRWAVSGLGETASLHWSDRPVEITLQDLEDAPEARLLVRGDFGQDMVCSFSLERADQSQSFWLKNGSGGCRLSPFLDSLRNSGRSGNELYLEFLLPDEDSPRRICLARVDTIWLVENLQIIQDFTPTEDKRTVLFGWRERGNVKNRALRLWSLDRQLEEPIEIAVEDGRSEAEFHSSLADFPHGLYRLELTILDEWAGPSSSALPSPDADSVFDLEVREVGITLLDSPARRLEVLARLLKQITKRRLEALAPSLQSAHRYRHRHAAASRTSPGILRRGRCYPDD